MKERMKTITRNSAFSLIVCCLLSTSAIAASPPSSAPSPADFTFSVVGSDSTNTTVCVAAETNVYYRIHGWIFVTNDCHYATGREATTNDPWIYANQVINLEGTRIWNGTYSFRRKGNTNTTTGCGHIEYAR